LAILSGKVGIFRRERQKMLFSNSRKNYTTINFSAKINYTGVEKRKKLVFLEFGKAVPETHKIFCSRLEKAVPFFPKKGIRSVKKSLSNS
jgi:hypothetical protein